MAWAVVTDDFNRLLLLRAFSIFYFASLQGQVSACYGGRTYTRNEADYCRANVDFCMPDVCRLLAKYTPPGCEDHRIRAEARSRLENCRDLNECFRQPITIECRTTLSDCPMLHMCRDGLCWPSKIDNVYCTYNADCKNSVYECVNNRCEIRPYGSSFAGSHFEPQTDFSWHNNNDRNNRPIDRNFPWGTWTSSSGAWSSWTNPRSSWTNPPFSSTHDDWSSWDNERTVNRGTIGSVPNGRCAFSEDCDVNSMCRENQCWPKVMRNSPNCRSDNQCEHRLYRCMNEECRIPGKTVHVSSNQIRWNNPGK